MRVLQTAEKIIKYSFPLFINEKYNLCLDISVVDRTNCNEGDVSLNIIVNKRTYNTQKESRTMQVEGRGFSTIKECEDYLQERLKGFLPLEKINVQAHN